jgi:zinc protease
MAMVLCVLALAGRCEAAAAAQALEPAGGQAEVQPDPAISTGMLANGMRFVILRHAPGQHEVSVRLRIGAGSLQEPEGQNGDAHLLEHMAFRGSTHVPGDEIWRALARLGVAFGADSNAFTTTSQTYFQFDLPEADPASVGAALMLMREIASELTLDPAALDEERHVVMAEARLTDSPANQADRAQTAFWFEGAPAAARDAMGDVDFLARVSADQLRHFYEAYYRPERTTLVVVGDVDPAAIEAEIRTRFGDWSGKGPPGPDPVTPPLRPAEVRTHVFVQAGAPSSLRMAWITPRDAAPLSVGVARRRLMEDLAVRILNRRLGAEPSPCLISTASRHAEPPIGDVAVLTADCPPGSWRMGLISMEFARRHVLHDGITQAELDRETASALHSFQIAAAGAEARPTPALANALVSSIDEDRPLTSPAQDLTMADAVYGKADTADIDEAMARLFQGAGPLVFLSSAQPVSGDGAALAQTLAAVDAAQLAHVVPRQVSTPKWPYASFGPAGAVAERSEVKDLGVSLIRFQNGVRLTVRPLALSGGQVLVRVAVGGGRLDLPRDRMSADWAADSGVVDSGGLKAMDRADLRRALAERVYSFSFTTGDDSFNLSGTTRPVDLDTQLQVLAAYLTAPGWRSEAFEHVRALFIALLPQFEASPNGVLGDYVSGLLHGGDPRWAVPTMADVAEARPGDLRSLLERPLASGPIEVAIVGDVSVDQAVQAVAATFGALPPRPLAPQRPADAYQTRFPAPTVSPVVRYHGGHADQALALEAWPIGDAYATGPSLADAQVLQQVLKNRLVERLRIADGATYTPRTALEASKTFPGFGYMSAAASVAPAQTGLVFSRISAITADLRNTPISADELERARRPALAALHRAQETDAYWLDALARAQTDPRRLDLIRNAEPGLRAVTAEGVQRSAEAYLRDERAFKLVIIPHGGEAP